MIKHIATSALAGLALCVPGQARIESGTKPLIQLQQDDSRYCCQYNTDDCGSGEYLGLYKHRGMKRAFILCPGGLTVDAARPHGCAS